jgi:hypothetical protein
MVGQFIARMTMEELIELVVRIVVETDIVDNLTRKTIFDNLNLRTLVNLVTNPADADLGATPAEVAAMAEAEVAHPRHMDD